MRYFFVIFFGFIFATHAFSQQEKQGKISGTIVNSETGNPAEFSTVALYKDDSLVTGAMSSAGGNFKLEHIPFGEFRLEITFIGYKTWRSDSIVISPDKPTVALGKIAFTPRSEWLKEVEVAGEKRMVEMAIDKKVFNVEKNITSIGGSANDVLQNVPSVSVDMDGNISLRGSGNVTVLIDGKPSGLTGSGRSAILQQIPASSIESIEVITNPSVKYDPDGMSGIINIILKKNQKVGANGSVSAGIATRNKFNGAGNINFRNNKINFFANYSYRHNPHFHSGTMNRENFFTDSTWYQNQQSNGTKTPDFQMLKMGFDFFMNNKNTLGLSAAYNGKKEFTDDKIEYQNLNYMRDTTLVSTRNNSEEQQTATIDGALNFKHSFENPKHQLTTDIAYSSSLDNEEETYKQQYFTYPALTLSQNMLQQNTYNNRNFRVLTLQSDYTKPFANGAKSDSYQIETGAKSIIRNADNNFSSESFNYSANDWQSDTLLNNHYTYEEQVHATYGTLAHSSGKFSYQAGLRLEQALTKSVLLLTNSVNERNYFSYFPGGHFAYEWNKINQLQISYSKRINRPSIESLIAFMNYEDPLNIRLGNPKLKPEYIHSAEVSWAFQQEKHTVTSSVYYRQIVNMIQRFRTVDATTGIGTVMFQNYSSATNTGFEFVARNELFKWWSITSNLNLFKSMINASNIQSDLHSEGFGWSAKMTWNINLPPRISGIQIHVSGDYKAPSPIAIGTLYAMNGVDVGVKKDILKGKGSINLNVSDVFNTRRFAIDIVQPGYHHYFKRKRETQIATLNFIYKFGKNDFQQKQKGKRKGETQPIRGEDLF